MAPRFNQVENLVLYEMYCFFSAPGAPEDVDMEFIRERLQGITSDVFLNAAIGSLVEKRLIEIVDVLSGTHGITFSGISRIEQELDDPTSFIAKHHENSSHNSDVPVPASDRIVKLDHNSDKYRNAVEKLDLLVELIRSTNEPIGIDKQEVLSELSFGRRLLDSATVKVGAVIALILTPLYAAYHEVAVTALKPVIQSAINAIKALVGL